jgi:hypothetical protein
VGARKAQKKSEIRGRQTPKVALTGGGDVQKVVFSVTHGVSEGDTRNGAR